MPVTRAENFRPLMEPRRTINSASSLACRASPASAPEPYFTSSTTTSQPAASFFERMEETIRGMQSTVPVTSRRA